MAAHDVESVARQMGITREELRSRIIRTLELAGLIPMGLAHSDAKAGDRIMGLIKVGVEVDNQGVARYYVQDTVTGEWRHLS